MFWFWKVQLPSCKTKACRVFYFKFILKLKAWENLIKGIWRMPWYKKTMKDVAACDKLRLGGKQPHPQISEWGNPLHWRWRKLSLWGELEDPVNWNILVAGGKENNNYSLSSGERKGRSLNRNYCGLNLVRQVWSWRFWNHMYSRCCKILTLTFQKSKAKSKKTIFSRMSWKAQPETVIAR